MNVPGTANFNATIPILVQIPDMPGGSGQSYGWVSVKDFGATGDGVTDDYEAIIAARDECWQYSPPKTLVFPDGEYAHSQTINFARFRFHILALGGNVRLKHTGAGVAVNFDGYAASPTAYSFVQTFGGFGKFTITGNANTTVGLYTNNVHHADFKADIRDAQTCWKADMAGGGAGAGVMSRYDIRVSQITESPMNPKPKWGADLAHLYACDVKLLIEACGQGNNWSVKLLNSNGNDFAPGTVESGQHGGIYIAGSNRNTFRSMHNEVNGASQDWYMGGNHNTYLGCAGVASTGTPKNIVVGSYNSFINCEFDGLRNETGAVKNFFQNCKLTGFTDPSNLSIRIGCEGVTNTIGPA